MAERNKNAICEGYDPSCTVLLDAAGGGGCSNLKLYSKYFSFSKIMEKNLDLLICRHIIEHIKNPLTLLLDIQSLNHKNLESVAFFETSDVNWILKNNVIFDFLYEHCSFFSPCSIKKAMEQVDCTLVETVEAFQGQYMWCFAKNKKNKSIEVENDRELESILQSGETYIKNEAGVIDKYKELIEQKQKEGDIAIWGAGGKGNSFLNMFDSQNEKIKHVFDINEQKEGLYIAGTGHKIENPETSFSKDIKNVFILNGNYTNEIVKWLKYRNNQVNVVVLDTI